MRTFSCRLNTLMKSSAPFLLALAALSVASPVLAQDGAPLYRVFLADGTALVSFGEWARVDDRVIFSMPLRASAGPSDLHLVSLPIGRVDLARTEEYADAVRASQYAATRGEADFARLSGDVAQALNRVAALTDPADRLAAAERARRALAEWPGAHHGYRAKEVSEIVGVLDEVISTLRASAGGPRYDLAFTATTAPPPADLLRPAPTESEVVETLMAAAGAVSSPTERVSLLHGVVAALDRAVDLLPEAFATRLRASALSGIAEEQRTDGLYAKLRAGILESVAQLSKRADVRGIERLRQRAREQDEKLGAKRADDMAGVFATLDAHLETAHRLRLQHDQWLSRIDTLRAYKRNTGSAVAALLQSQDSLDDIRTLAGPPPQRLRTLQQRLSREARRLALVEPPKELGGVHAVLRSAFELAENAIQLRRDAIETTDLDLARQASSAAAGAQLLLARARDDLDAALRSPVDQP
jgi:hypothetical protein